MKHNPLALIAVIIFALEALFYFFVSILSGFSYISIIYIASMCILAYYTYSEREKERGLLWGSILYAVFNLIAFIYRLDIPGFVVFLGSLMFAGMMFMCCKNNKSLLKNFYFLPPLVIFIGLILMGFPVSTMSINTLLEPIGILLMLMTLN
ncbi:MAG: hypothetical protein Q4D13_05275 [Erysipelotrichaceae bacterium]|nr:hypothetical protein [Erysipelotrichaceae bacterium]